MKLIAVHNIIKIDKEARKKWTLFLLGAIVFTCSQLAWFYGKQIQSVTGNYISDISVLILVVSYSFFAAGTNTNFFVRETKLDLNRLLEIMIFVLSIFIIVSDAVTAMGISYHVNVVNEIINLSTGSFHRILPFLSILFPCLMLFFLFNDKFRVNRIILTFGISGFIFLGTADFWSFYLNDVNKYFIGHPVDILRIIGVLSIFLANVFAFTFLGTCQDNLKMKEIYSKYIKMILPYFVILYSLIMNYLILRNYSTDLLSISDGIVLIILTFVRGIITVRESAMLRNEVEKREIMYSEKEKLNILLEKELEEEKGEVARARLIHKRILPDNTSFTLNGIQVAGCNISAKEMGGDYYDFFHLKDSNVLIVLCDVMGKGLAAALQTLLVRNTIKNILDDFISTPKLLDRVNEILFEDLNIIESYVTMFALTYDSDNKKISFSSAGHNPAIMLEGRTEVLRTLKTKGTAVGLKKDICYQEQSIQVSNGDVICLYSDGLIDVQNYAKERYSMNRLVSIIRHNTNKSAEEIKEAVLEDVASFIAGEQQRDDITFVIIKIG